MPAFNIGADADVQLGSAGATTTLVSKKAYIKSFKLGETVGDEDITVLQPADYAKVLGYLLNEMSGTCDVLIDGTFWKFLGDIIRGKKTISLGLFPRGTATGAEQITMSILITGRDRTIGVGEFDKGTFSWKRTGTVTEGVVP